MVHIFITLWLSPVKYRFTNISSKYYINYHIHYKFLTCKTFQWKGRWHYDIIEEQIDLVPSFPLSGFYFMLQSKCFSGPGGTKHEGRKSFRTLILDQKRENPSWHRSMNMQMIYSSWARVTILSTAVSPFGRSLCQTWIWMHYCRNTPTSNETLYYDYGPIIPQRVGSTISTHQSTALSKFKLTCRPYSL